MKKAFCWLFAFLQKFLRRDKTASVAVAPSQPQASSGETSSTISSFNENKAEESNQPPVSNEANLKDNGKPKETENNVIGEDVSGGDEGNAESIPTLPTAEETKNEETERREFIVEMEKKDDEEISEVSESKDELKNESANRKIGDESEKPNILRQEPISVGGKRKNLTSEIRRSTERAKPSRKETPRAEFVCIREAGEWIVAVEAEGAKGARQGKNVLNQRSKIFFPVQNIGEETVVSFKDGKEEFLSLPGALKKPLVFQTSKEWKDEKGRLVKEVANGYYVVFAHESFGERINKNIPIDPEPTNWPQWDAHYFFPREGGEEDGFLSCQCMATRNRFALRGDVISDNSKEGDLFVLPPQVNDTDGWKAVSWLTFGREDGDDVIQKISLDDHSSAPVELADFLRNQSGRFFVRIYDDDCRLVYSVDFRHVQGLTGIQVDGAGNWKNAPIFPGKKGHNKSIVRFIGDGSYTVLPPKGIVENGNEYEIPGQISMDKTCWQIKNRAGESVLIDIVLPRVWWKWNNESCQKWFDTPIGMPRLSLKESDGEIIVHFGIKTNIKVGFDIAYYERDCRQYSPCRNRDEEFWFVALPLEHFSEHEILSNPIKRESFLCCVFQNGDGVAKLIRIPADAPLINCEYVPLSVFKKDDNRFSCQEIAKSGIQLKRMGRGRWCVLSTKHIIRVDKRRKTAYPRNIRALILLLDSEDDDEN